MSETHIREHDRCPICHPYSPTEGGPYPPTLRCRQCGERHMLDTSLPSHIWNQIARPDEILCVICIDQRLQAAGIKAEAEFYFVGHALVSKSYGSDVNTHTRHTGRCPRCGMDITRHPYQVESPD